MGCGNHCEGERQGQGREKRSHTKAREARDAIRKGWDDLVTLLEEECTGISEERRGMEFKIVDLDMAERERWEGRINAVQNGGEVAIAVAVAAGSDAMLVWDRYPCGPQEGAGWTCC